jgi:hypothetical protein
LSVFPVFLLLDTREGSQGPSEIRKLQLFASSNEMLAEVPWVTSRQNQVLSSVRIYNVFFSCHEDTRSVCW